MRTKKNPWHSQLRKWFSETFTFAFRYFKSPKEVGTPFPCSSAVAKSILEYIPPSSSKQGFHYLEVGPGTGAFTREFVKRLRPEDQLDLVEIDPVFCKVLQKKYKNSENVHVHQSSIEKWNPAYKYDAIISAVPLNALPTEETLDNVLSAYKNLIKGNGILSSVEYVGTSTARKMMLFGKKKKQFDKLLKLKTQFFDKYGVKKNLVWQNFPPARITHYKMTLKKS